MKYDVTWLWTDLPDDSFINKKAEVFEISRFQREIWQFLFPFCFNFPWVAFLDLKSKVVGEERNDSNRMSVSAGSIK